MAFQNLISRNLSGSKVLFIFILTGIIYTAMLLITIPKVMDFSGGMKILDMMPTGYNSQYVTELFTALGSNGRDIYLYQQLPLDMIFPGISAISFALVMAFLLKKLGKLESKWFYLSYLPFFGGLFDYFENFSIIALLKSYPTIFETLVAFSATFSVLKASFTTLYMTILIILLLMLGFQKIFSKRIITG